MHAPRSATILFLVALFASPACSDAPETPDPLATRLAQATAALGPDYVPRTRHLREDGSPQFTNRLILESSPYLRQHAHNPVNWYPWGDEAFETARRLGLPVLLSVGYSTCHWCHVMEEESFEDVEIAEYLNEHYVAIKVDREERPDVDAIYMRAVQNLTGRGGWPMTVWLTPDRQPFFGGTYFPARDGDRGARRGFLTILQMASVRYQGNRDDIVRAAADLSRSLERPWPRGGDGDLPDVVLVDRAAEWCGGKFDDDWGGLNQAPKFPSTLPIRVLLRHHRRTGDADSLRMAEFTLQKMAAGGMHDQIGGGFHRYSVDREWLVPHFEKMLYDNALLAVAYLEAFQVTGDDGFAGVARSTLDYVAREMTAADGGFWSATDADSKRPDGHTEEGWFFTWTPAEIETVVGKDAAAIVAARYGVTASGNFEGRTILHVVESIPRIAARLEQDAEAIEETLHAARQALYDARGDRPSPILDDKILTSWNGLMISAFATGGRVLDDAAYVQAAVRAAEFTLDSLRVDGRLRRSFKDGGARHTAYLDDYAFLIAGLLDLFETTSDPRWMDEAVSLQNTLDTHYLAEDGTGYYQTADDAEALLTRIKPAYDGAEPSGNSVAVLNLLRLSEWTLDDRYRAAADRILRALGPSVTRAPMSLTDLLLAIEFRHGPPKEIAIVVPRSRDQADPFLAELRGTFVPNRVSVVAVQGKDLAERAKRVPWLTGKRPLAGKPTAYVCERGVCLQPATDLVIFREQLAAIIPPR